MSYDVDVMGEWFNITSNMGAFFREFNVYPPDWNGKPREEIGDAIELGLTAIRLRPLGEMKARFDAPNGWGTVEGSIVWLEDVLAACRMAVPPPPAETVQVSW